jgi:hypothetical protein
MVHAPVFASIADLLLAPVQAAIFVFFVISLFEAARIGSGRRASPWTEDAYASRLNLWPRRSLRDAFFVRRRVWIESRGSRRQTALRNRGSFIRGVRNTVVGVRRSRRRYGQPFTLAASTPSPD